MQLFGISAGHQPDQRLAAVHAVILGLQVLGKGRQLLAQVDEVLVALGPVTKEAEFLDDVLLRLLGARCGNSVHVFIIARLPDRRFSRPAALPGVAAQPLTTLHRVPWAPSSMT